MIASISLIIAMSVSGSFPTAASTSSPLRLTFAFPARRGAGIFFCPTVASVVVEDCRCSP